MMRIGQVIQVKPEGLEAYKRYHADPLPGVNEMIKACNIQNYSIYSTKPIWQRWLRIQPPKSGGIW